MKENKYKIGFIISSTIALIAIVFVVSTYSLATENHTIYTRDQLSEIVGEQDNRLNETLELYENANYAIHYYLNNELISELDNDKQYELLNYICLNGESVTWNSVNSKPNISNAADNVECDLFLKEITLFKYKSNVPYYQYIVPQTGTYKIELWGATGTGYSYGGYVSGDIQLNQNEVLYFYLGGTSSNNNGGYNGGGAGGGAYIGGGGATDVRIFTNTPSTNDLLWYSTIGLKSRIMVAGGGGSGGYMGGFAGGLTGYRGYDPEYPDAVAYGGTQIAGGTFTEIASPYSISTVGEFGKGGIGGGSSTGGSGGGGGGYYGGAGGTRLSTGTWKGGGGSSYISGHTGCVAIQNTTPPLPKNNCTTGTTDIECSKHYNGKVFSNTLMIDGTGYAWANILRDYQPQAIPNPLGGYYPTRVGNNTSGYAKISFLG